jgi:5-formyltetrahydrofolate cyclo-ligase
MSDEYQPRTPERLCEMLRSQAVNPRSWQRETAAMIERLQAERNLWEARCIGAVWLLPDELKFGELQDAAKRAAELLANQQIPATEKP